VHELGLAQSILDIVHEHVPLARATTVRRVRIRIGEFAGVIPDSLVFCFGAITAGTPFGHAQLDIEHVPGRDLRVVDVELAEPAELADGADAAGTGGLG